MSGSNGVQKNCPRLVRIKNQMARVASAEKVAMEEGAEPSTKVEHARYDGGERGSEGSLFRPLSPLCTACTLLRSFEEIDEGYATCERGELDIRIRP